MRRISSAVREFVMLRSKAMKGMRLCPLDWLGVACMLELSQNSTVLQ